MQESVKFGMAMLMLRLSMGEKFSSVFKGWTVWNWLRVAGLPAGLYTIQNLCALQAYQHLDSLTFNVLNQTKTLSAALCCWIIMGKRQSTIQLLALFLLLLSALVMEQVVSLQQVVAFLQGEELFSSANANSKASYWDAQRFWKGVVPILLASLISGLAGALSQQNLQHHGRNAYLFSMELCVASIAVLLTSLLFSPDGRVMREGGFFAGWTIYTWIPIATNAAGGIVVGLVTKYAGSVRKGFALIFGIFLSGLLQQFVANHSNTDNDNANDNKGLSPEQILGGCLAGISLYLHATFPPQRTPLKTVDVPSTSTTKKQQQHQQPHHVKQE